MAQPGAALHKPLQKGGDGHQAQATGDDQAGQGHLAKGGEVAADVDDRQARHRDRGGHRKQGFPQPNLVAGTEGARENDRAHGNHQGAGDHRELGDREAMAPGLKRGPQGAGQAGDPPRSTNLKQRFWREGLPSGSPLLQPPAWGFGDPSLAALELAPALA